MTHRAQATPIQRSAAANATPAKIPVRITHPERIVYTNLGLSKGDVATYYAAVAERMLAELADRPLSLLRCPGGIGESCFFQKHLAQNIGDHVHRLRIRDSAGTNTYFSVSDVAGLLELVQMNAIEFHPWAARTDDVEHCDRIVFDLDPDTAVEWKRVIAAARDIRARLGELGLESFVRTSGGKGLHVVVPLAPAAPWGNARDFSAAFAETMSARSPDAYVARAGEKNRSGRIFIDWMRNGRGATSVASYSLRARAEAGIAMPVAWAQLGRVSGGAMFALPRALKRLPADPWRDIAKVRQALPRSSK